MLGIFSIFSIVPSSWGQTEPTPSTTVSPGPTDDGVGGFGTSGTAENPNDNEPGSGEASGTPLPTGADDESTPSVTWTLGDLSCDTYSGAGCHTANNCSDGSTPVTWTMLDTNTLEPLGTYDQCPEDPEPTTTTTTATPTVDIPGEALAAFKKAELPSSAITVQPPGGETLVNFKTILSTTAARHQINIRLDKVDLDLVLEVWPSSFVWHHGDGTTQESTVAGTAWTEGADVDGDGFITHVYTSALKDAPVSVDTTWSANFKVAGAAEWRAVDGTVLITGEPVALSVREATPELVTDPG